MSLLVLMIVHSLCSSRSVPIFIPRIFVVHIRIFERFLFPENGFIVLWVGCGCGREAPFRAGHGPGEGCGDACEYDRRGAYHGDVSIMKNIFSDNTCSNTLYLMCAEIMMSRPKWLLLKVSKKNKVTMLQLWMYVVRFTWQHDELDALMLANLFMEVAIRVTNCLCLLLTWLLTGMRYWGRHWRD